MAETMTSDKFACIVARILDDRLAKNIAVLNISQVSSLADYFVICSADSTTQVKSLTGNVKEKIKNLFLLRWSEPYQPAYDRSGA